jgi:hypothetical protein
MTILFSAQILALALIPFLSGGVPRNEVNISPLALIGFEDQITTDYMVGTWKYSDEFFRWGITDKERSRVRPFKGHSLMTLDKDGSLKMVNFFKPDEGRWEMTADGIAIVDPRFPERSAQVLPIRKRDGDRIWVLLPFSGGSAGIGMVRVKDEEFKAEKTEVAVEPKKPRKTESQRRVFWPDDSQRKEKQSSSDSPDGWPTIRREFSGN